jgi:hypothetical protein
MELEEAQDSWWRCRPFFQRLGDDQLDLLIGDPRRPLAQVRG